MKKTILGGLLVLGMLSTAGMSFADGYHNHNYQNQNYPNQNGGFSITIGSLPFGVNFGTGYNQGARDYGYRPNGYRMPYRNEYRFRGQRRDENANQGQWQRNDNRGFQQNQNWGQFQNRQGGWNRQGYGR